MPWSEKGEMAQSQSSPKGSKSTTKLAASPKKLLAVTTRCNKIGLIVTEKKASSTTEHDKP